MCVCVCACVGGGCGAGNGASGAEGREVVDEDGDFGAALEEVVFFCVFAGGLWFGWVDGCVCVCVWCACVDEREKEKKICMFMCV